jgi:hypothetical protein
MLKAFAMTLCTASRSSFPAGRNMNGGGTLISSAEIFPKSHWNLSQQSVVTGSSASYGASESFRQTHQIPPMRAPQSTTKAVSVNMRPRENLRFRPQVNRISSRVIHPVQSRKNRGRHSCKLRASSDQSSPGRMRLAGATARHEIRRSLRGVRQFPVS